MMIPDFVLMLAAVVQLGSVVSPDGYGDPWRGDYYVVAAPVYFNCSHPDADTKCHSVVFSHTANDSYLRRCIKIGNVWIRNVDGTEVPVSVNEQRSADQYTMTVKTNNRHAVVGPIIYHHRAIDRCAIS